ncbi:Metacaspase-1B [Aspergillus caelatus]|uniref:Metacaspase-1B n=2 Tax=Aspergillus subgen. Circumdati TaxID=2720871 RepID=A0A5N6ZLY5_9EURO|nr:Metacaspase-1B [Aspergillus caelatus]KAE8358475.1 Metacaspase-1B [Aspergillus caelatus]KAE8419853.1 Metacaspase-1B [Aspergillus pseudocaelatus]
MYHPNYNYPPPQSGWGGGYYPPPQQHQQQQWSAPPPPPQQPYYSNGYPPPSQSPHSYSPPQYPPPGHYGHHTPTPPPSSGSQYRSYHSHSPSWGQMPPRPPMEAQKFGNGAPSNYRFQYSACTGRRKALLIGINYAGQPNALRGCINDVTNMSTFLHDRYGYRREDMVILTDDQQNPMSVPTKANILRAMQWLVKDAQPNDSLFIHFSGHGGRTPDLDGDEEDGYDDVIYPLDYRTAGHIVDDDMHAIMVRPLQPGVRLTAIFDSCHSGTALDLPYVYSTQGILKEPNLAKEAAQDLFSAITSYGQGDFASVAQTAIGFLKKAALGDSARERTVRTKTSPADVVMFSGSKDTQTSADTFQDGEARGALSWAFIKTLQQRPNQSYLQLLNSVRSELEGKYSQKPQLSCSHPLDTNLLFVM